MIRWIAHNEDKTMSHKAQKKGTQGLNTQGRGTQLNTGQTYFGGEAITHTLGTRLYRTRGIRHKRISEYNRNQSLNLINRLYRALTVASFKEWHFS